MRTSSKTEEPDSAGSYATTPNLNYEKLPSPSLEYNEEEVEDTRYVQYENAQQDDDTPAANYIYVKNSHQSWSLRQSMVVKFTMTTCNIRTNSQLRCLKSSESLVQNNYLENLEESLESWHLLLGV